MAQGSGKLAKKQSRGAGNKTSAVAVKRKKPVSKGRKYYAPKKKATMALGAQAERETSKTINKRNETIVAAKAVSVGINFFCSDLTAKGSRERQKQVKARDKKQQDTKLSDRLKNQLKKLE
jgi:Protein of unknown function (DUF2462)